MGNLDIWDRHADIDPAFTKPITGKAYKGTSPSPQHVIWCLTDMFGPAGVGFGWIVRQEAFQPLGEEVLHWCRIWFWHGSQDHGFDAYGQTKAVMKTRAGLLVDEDAPKKSLTDAIVKAASQVGVAANIFLGRWDDQKYVNQVRDEIAAEKLPPFNPASARDRIKRKIEMAASRSELVDVWRTESDVIAEIGAAAPAMKAELVAAAGARKAALSQEQAA